MKLETDYIEKLAKLLVDNGLSEISLEDGEQAITLRKDAVGAPAVVAPVAVPTPIAATQAAPVNAGVESTKKGKAITSPMVGTFYKSPSPDAEAFVEVGSTIKLESKM